MVKNFINSKLLSSPKREESVASDNVKDSLIKFHDLYSKLHTVPEDYIKCHDLLQTKEVHYMYHRSKRSIEGVYMVMRYIGRLDHKTAFSHIEGFAFTWNFQYVSNCTEAHVRIYNPLTELDSITYLNMSETYHGWKRTVMEKIVTVLCGHRNLPLEEFYYGPVQVGASPPRNPPGETPTTSPATRRTNRSLFSDSSTADIEKNPGPIESVQFGDLLGLQEPVRLLTEQLDSMREEFRFDLKRVVSDAKDITTNFVENLDSKVKENGIKLETVMKVGTFSTGLACILSGHYNSNTTLLSTGVATLGGLGIYCAVRHAQSYQDGEDSNYAGIFSEYVAKWLELPQCAKKIKDWASFFVSIDKLRKTLPDLIVYILETLDALMKHLFDVQPFARMFPETLGLNAHFRNFLYEIRDFIREFRIGSTPTLLDSYGKVVVYIARLDEYLLKGEKHCPKYTLLMTYRKDLEDMRKNLLLTIPGLESRRVEPASVLFKGAPGSFKSGMAGRLGDVLKEKYAAYYKTEELPAVFQMTSGIEFYDGYSTGTEIMVWDEFGQLRDSPSVPKSEYFEFIRMVNINPCNLNMAAVEAKGTTFCKIKWMIGTTNAMTWQIESVTDKGAVDRRWQRQFICCPMQEVSIDETVPPGERKVDWTKVGDHPLTKTYTDERGKKFFTMPDALMEFHELVGNEKKRELGRKWEFSEVVDDCFNRHLDHVQQHKVNLFSAQLDLLEHRTKREKGSIPAVYEIQTTQGGIDMYELGSIESQPDFKSLCMTDFLRCFENYDFDLDDLTELQRDYVRVKDLFLIPGFSELFLASMAHIRVIMLNEIYEGMGDRLEEINPDLFSMKQDPTKVFDAGLIAMFCMIENQQTKLEMSMDRMRHKSSKFFSEIFSWGSDMLRDYRKTIMFAIPVAYGICYIYKLYYKAEHPEVEVESSQSVLVPKKKVVVKNLSDLLKAQETQMGYSSDPNGYNMAVKCMESNMYTVWAQNEKTQEDGSTMLYHSGYGIVVTCNLMIIPLHFVEKWKNKERKDGFKPRVIFMRKRGNLNTIKTYSTEEVLSWKRTLGCGTIRRDFCFIHIPFEWGLHVDLTKKFKRRDAYKGITRFNDIMLANNHCEIIKGNLTNVWNSRSDAAAIIPSIKVFDCVGPGKDVNSQDVGPVLNYKMMTTEGTCGSLALDMNRRIVNEKICGIHVSGTKDGTGSAIIIYQEDIEWALKDVAYEDLCNNQETFECQSGSELESIFFPIKNVPPPTVWPRSSYKKAVTFELLASPLLVPSNVSMRFVVEALENYKTGIYPMIEQKEVEILTSALSDHIFSQSNIYIPELILTPEQVVLGVEGFNFPTMGRPTSPGYPYVLDRKRPGKEDWFGSEDEIVLGNEKWNKLLDDLDTLIDQILNGERPVCPFMINLKDELRKLGKKPRVFGAGPMVLLMACYIYFGSFNAWFHANLIRNCSSLGINVYGSQWHSLALYLKNEYVLAGDFKSFDTSHHPKIAISLLMIFERFYKNSTPKERKIRRILFLDVIIPYYIHGNTVYESGGGLPTGHLLTALVNTLMCIWLQLYGVYRCLERKVTPIKIFDHVRIICNGDDSIVSICYEDLHLITEEKFARYFAEIGYTYTSDDKEGGFKDRRRIHEITFLKRTFKFEPYYQEYIAPLLLTRLLEFPNWTRMINSMEVLRLNLDKTLIELSAHGESIFNKYQMIIIEKYIELWGVEPRCGSFIGCLELYRTSQVVGQTVQVGQQYIQINMNPNTTSYPTQQDLLSTSFINSEACRLEYAEQTNYISEYVQMNDEVKTEVDVDAVYANDSTVAIVKEGFNMRSFISDAQAGLVNTEMKRWLERPYLWEYGSFASTDGVGTFTKHRWQAPLNGYWIINKMKGNFTIKADLKIRIVINGNNTQSGLYALWYLPMGGTSSTDAYEQNWLYMHLANKTHITQIPHVKIDVNCDTEVELYIPWSSGLNSYAYHSTIVNWGTPGWFGIYPLVPISAVTGSLSASYSMWVEYLNVELGSVGYAQMGTLKKTMNLGKDFLAEEQKDAFKPSRIMKLGSDVSGLLKNVPMLSTFSGPLSWALEMGSKTAKAWGFSKPIIIDNPMRVARENFIGAGVVDFPSTAVSTQYTMGNHVQVDVGDNIDELDIVTFCSRFSWLNTVTWAKTDAIGALLYTLDMNPGWYTSTTDSGVTLRHYTPVGWLISNFVHWRSSFVVRLHFVKTIYHSGRLEVGFEPFVDGIWTPGATVLGDQNYLLKVIVDVREHQFVDIRVPYVSHVPWLENTKSMGKLRVFVLDPLTSPDMVPSAISFFVEVRTDKDIEVNGPTGGVNDLVPVVPSSYQSGEKECLIGFLDLGSNSLVPQVSQYTHGEEIRSLRTILKRACVVKGPLTMTNALRYNIPAFSSYIYKCTGAAIQPASSTTSSSVVTRDMVGMMSAMFTYSRGGTIYRFVPVSTNTTQTFLVNTDTVSSSATTITTWPGTANAVDNGMAYRLKGMGLAWFGNQAPGSGYLIPQHTSTISRINMNNIFNQTDGLNYLKLLTDPTQIHLYQRGATLVTILITREAADDFNLQQFVSIPPMYQDAVPTA